jgi:hypothetical protein
MTTLPAIFGLFFTRITLILLTPCRKTRSCIISQRRYDHGVTSPKFTSIPALCCLACSLAIAPKADAQNLIFDQRSGSDSLVLNGIPVQDNHLIQSFTPEVAAIGFVQFQAVLYPEGGSSLTRVNLRQGGTDGQIMARTDSLRIEDNGLFVRTYYFPDNVPIEPGQMYWLDVELQSLAAPALSISFELLYPSSYERGDLYTRGSPSPGFDLWFREGVVVPEPSSLVLCALGAVVILGRGCCRSASVR